MIGVTVLLLILLFFFFQYTRIGPCDAGGRLAA